MYIHVHWHIYCHRKFIRYISIYFTYNIDISTASKFFNEASILLQIPFLSLEVPSSV